MFICHQNYEAGQATEFISGDEWSAVPSNDHAIITTLHLIAGWLFSATQPSITEIFFIQSILCCGPQTQGIPVELLTQRKLCQEKFIK